MKASAKFTCRACGFKAPHGNTECPVCCTKINSSKKRRVSKKANGYTEKHKKLHSLGPRLIEKTNAILRRRKLRKPKERRKKSSLLMEYGSTVSSENNDETIEKELTAVEDTGTMNLHDVTRSSKTFSYTLSSSLLSQTNGSSLGDQLMTNKSTLFHIKKPSFLKSKSTETLNQSSYVLSNATESVSRIFECIPPPKLVLMNRPGMTYKDKLDLSLWPILDSQWSYIQQSNNLKLTELSLKNNFDITDATLIEIGSMQYATLRSINLEGCSSLLLKNGLRAMLSKCSLLQTLDISRCQHVYDETVKLICCNCKCLQNLLLNGCKAITDKSHMHIIENRMVDLKLLSTKQCPQIVGKYLGELLKACPLLLSIDLDDCVWVDDKNLASVSAQKIAWGYTDSQGGLIPLKRLSLRNCCRISDAGLTWVMSKTRQMKEIVLSGCVLVTDVSLDLIGKWCSKLSILLLSDCIKITNEGLKRLADHQHYHLRNEESSLDGLQELDISGCKNVDDFGVEALVKSLKNIRKINLSRLPNITDSSLRAMSSSCILLEEIETSMSEQVTGTGVKMIARKIRTCTTDGTSISIGKHATQSTTLACREASIAVNGNTWGSYGESYDDEEGEISQTIFEKNPWWEVDLDEVWDIGLLRIWSPPSDEMIRYNFPMWVMASKKPFRKEIDSYDPDAVIYKKCFHECSRVIKWDLRQRARYIRIQTLNFAPLLLAQVEVFFRGSTLLDIQGCYGVGSFAISEISRRFLHLVKLNVSDNPNVTNRAVELMARNLLNLQELDLSGCSKVSDDGMYGMSLHKREFTVLKLSSCTGLSAVGILYAISRTHNLNCLEMAFLPLLTNTGLYFIARVVPTIHTLILHACTQITENAVIRVAPYLKYARAEYNLTCSEGGFDFFPLPFAHSRQFRDKVLHQIGLFASRLPVLQKKIRNYLSKSKTTKPTIVKQEKQKSSLVLDTFVDDNQVGEPEIEKNIILKVARKQKKADVDLRSVSKYSNLAMFEVAREESRRHRSHINRVLLRIGKGARAYKIQRCWRDYKDKCKQWELKQLQLLVYQKELAAIELLQKRVRIYLAKKKVKELRAIRLAYLLSLQSQNVALADVDPAWKRDMAAMIIQGYVREWLAHRAAERKRIREWLEHKASKTIKMAFMRLIMRRRGKRLLWQKRFDKAVKTLTKVQARWRGKLQRDAMCHQKSAARTIERMMVRRQNWNIYLYECSMATKIQSLIRRRIGYIRVQKRRKEKFIYDQATKCQYVWRSYKARKRISVMKINIMLRLQRERKATRILQRWMRGRWTRLRFLRVLKITHLRFEGAAITIQRWHWEFVYPRIYSRLSIYANRIIKMCRARLFRWRLNKLIRMTRLQKQLAYEREMEWKHLNEMAIFIQNAWRCRQARKLRRLAIKEKAHRIAQMMIIQKMQDLQDYMSHVQRRAKTNAAATQIQRIMRGYLGRKFALHTKKLKEEREKLAAMQIQSQIRSRAAARVIRKLKMAVRAIKPRTILPRRDADLENAKLEGGIGDVIARNFDLKKIAKDYLKKRHYKKNELKVGNIVEANWEGRHRWFRGKVLRINPPSNMYEGITYKINYVDNYIEKRVPRYWIRLLQGETELWPEETDSKPEVASDEDKDTDDKDPSEDDGDKKSEIQSKAAADLDKLNKVLNAKKHFMKKRKDKESDKATEDLEKLEKVLNADKSDENIDSSAHIEGKELEQQATDAEQNELEKVETDEVDGEDEAKRLADEEAAEEARREKDPIYIEYGMIAKKRKERSMMQKIKSKIPLTSVWWRDRQAKNARQAINDHRAKHAIYTKSKVSSKIRTGIDDIRIVLGEKDNAIMVAQQRRNLSRKQPFYICIDVDLRANIRCDTNDELPVYIWYKRSNKPRLVVELKVDGSYMFGGQRWNDYRKQGFERVFSNESRDIPNQRHWTRLPFTIWMRKSVHEIPIDDIMVSRITRTRMEQRAMIMNGFIQFPVDLANFGMDYGLRLWYKFMQEFHDEIKEEDELVEKYKLEFRGLQGIPPDIIPADLADQAGNADDNKVIREVVEYIGLSDHRVIQLYESFKKLCKADVNPKEEWYLTVDELFHLLGLRFGKKEYGDFVHIMWDIARLDPDERIYFKHFVKLCGIWCIMGREQILLCVFNSQDPMNDGSVPFERLRDLMWELHKESLQFRRRKVRGILDNMGVEEFIKDGSGKWSFRAFTKMHFKYPQLLYPLFFFQWGLCEKTISLNFWENQRAHLHKHRENVTKEVREHEEAIAALRVRETQAALTRATLKDTVKAILTNGPMPEGATEETVELATRRVRKLKKKAKRLHVDINVLVAKMK